MSGGGRASAAEGATGAPLGGFEPPPRAVDVERRPDGSLILRSPLAVEPYGRHIPAFLWRWPVERPDQTWIAQRRGADRAWSRLTCKDAARLASVAKAKACDACFLIGNEGIQMHGGIGMTDEHEIGLFLKRARVAQATFGDAAFHRDRYTAVSGY